ncbi:MAG: hypothetical protein LBC27_05355 [Spirochaetaceae bacterium]|jgi:hypothetical protein|nr:hypothetical protein [Spirochaetaceae bacterium]
MREERAERQRVAVYIYGSSYYIGTNAYPLKSYIPVEGEQIIVKSTPYFRGAPVLFAVWSNTPPFRAVRAGKAK